MRNALLGSCIVLLLAVSSVSAQTERKKQNTPGGIVAPKGTVIAPTRPAPKSKPTTAPRGSTMAPLTKAECEGLGGKVRDGFKCDSGLACHTVDAIGVIRSACISK